MTKKSQIILELRELVEWQRHIISKLKSNVLALKDEQQKHAIAAKLEDYFVQLFKEIKENERTR